MNIILFVRLLLLIWFTTVFVKGEQYDHNIFKGKRIIEIKNNGKTKRYIDGEIIIKLKHISLIESFNKFLNAEFGDVYLVKEFDLQDVGVFNISSNHYLPDICNKIYETDFVKYAIPHSIIQESSVPNDISYIINQQNDFSGMYFPFAWEIEKGDDNVKIGIIDSGIDIDHADLESIILGYDYIDNDDSPNDVRGHGTAVSGLIGATTNNFLGIASTMWNKYIVVEKIIDENNNISIIDYYESVHNLIDNHQVRLINVSIEDTDNPENELFYNDLADYASSNNCLIIIAAGNSGQISYMARSDKVLTVGVSNIDFPNYSYGPQMDISAHGKDIFSTIYNGTYSNFYLGSNRNSGTSFSTPFVTGVAGLVLSKNSNLNYSELKQILINSTDDVQKKDFFGNWLIEPGWDEYTGFGNINAFKAVSGIDYRITNLSSNIIDALNIGDYLDIWTISGELLGRVYMTLDNLLDGKYIWNGVINDNEIVASGFYLYIKNENGLTFPIVLEIDNNPLMATNIQISSDKIFSFELSGNDEIGRVSLFIFDENEEFIYKDIDNILIQSGMNSFTLTTDLAYNYIYKLVLIDVAGNIRIYSRSYERPMTPQLQLNNHFHQHCGHCEVHIHPKLIISNFNPSLLDYFNIYRRINLGDWDYIANTSSATFIDQSIEIFPRGDQRIDYKIYTISNTPSTSFASNVVTSWFDWPNKVALDYIPLEFIMHSAYPNPFNPATTIQYGLPVPSHITFTIHNMVGQLVKTIQSKNISAGYHSIQWNSLNDAGEKVPSGMYIVQMNAISTNGKKHFTHSQKLVLLK
ncbi:MAG: S8 family serine peptidase [Candidatus Marinimicrobia bacterium]|nr:S8 family serine peptidase [Candidatus Neomarinimicrobiota bacterium]